jgi:nucleotide-binding universal stress UspA family protein
MIEIRRILCPIDFSDYSRHALDHAVTIARWYGSVVKVLHVASGAIISSSPGPPGFEPIVLTRPDLGELMEDLKRFIAPASVPTVTIDPIVLEGNAAGEILREASSMGADLLVMGTHGRSGFERVLLGSVTEKVLRKAACPVLTVPRRHPDAVPSAPVVFKEILCPVDFSPCSLHALAYATSLAQEAGGRLTVLHVLAVELGGTGEKYDFPVVGDDLSLGDYRRMCEESARQHLQAAVSDDVSNYCSVERLLLTGKSGHEILRVAEERQSDLIVMGVQGRGRADLVLFGSTTNQVVRQAACPVLTLRERHPAQR